MNKPIGNFHRRLGSIIYQVFYQIMQLSGLRFIWHKIIPPIDKETKKRRPATILLWGLGIYVALYGYATQRYENRIDIIENRANWIFNQLGTENYKTAIGRIPQVQKMKCPIKPEIFDFSSVFKSYFQDTVYAEINALLKETVEGWKSKLYATNLSSADLSYLDLSQADLRGAILIDVDFTGTSLEGAILDGANIQGSNFSNSDLSEASATFLWIQQQFGRENTLFDEFRDAGYTSSYESLDLKEPRFEDCIFNNANLVGIKLLQPEQLFQAKSLKNIKMDSLLLNKIMDIDPKVLQTTK